MTILLDHFLLIGAAAAFGYPLLRRPLSEDDGNWYYYAWFRDRGVRLYRDVFSAFGYFGVFGTAALLFGLFRAKTAGFFNRFKATWYFFNALSVYWLCFVWTGNRGMALIAALAIALVTAVPNTLFFLTYAEHFMILPLSLSLIALHLGLAGAGHGFFWAAGLFAGWAVQIKPTALVFAAGLFPFCFGSASPVADGTLYLTAVLGTNLLPCFLLRRDRSAWRAYLLHTFGGAFGLLTLLLDRVSVRLSRRLIPEGLRSGRAFDYLAGHHRLTWKEQAAAWRRFMGPALRDLRLVVILASLQVPGLFSPGRFDSLAAAMLGLLAVCLFMQQIQKNYYTPHFNTAWMPLSVLAAITIQEAGASAAQGRVVGWFVILFLLIETPRFVRIIIAGIGKEAREEAGFLGPVVAALHGVAEPIGAYVKRHSQPGEKLLVLGDQPSIYLYADRQCFDPDYLFMYTHTGLIHDPAFRSRLFDRFRQAPPEWVLFFQNKYSDGWTMASLEEATGVPYRFVWRCQLKDRLGAVIRSEEGVALDFPLYRRDDDRYRAVLAERAAFALSSSDAAAYRDRLAEMTDLCPEDPEARLRLSALEQCGAGPEALRQYLESRPHPETPEQAALVSLLLGDLDRHEGRLEPAARRYEEASREKAGDFRIFNGLSEIAYARGDMAGALQFLERAYRINPWSAEISNNLGVLYALAGNREKAALFFRKALRVLPGYRDAADNLEQLQPGRAANAEAMNLAAEEA